MGEAPRWFQLYWSTDEALVAAVGAGNLRVWQVALLCLLLVGWLAAFCFNFYAGLVVKSWRRADRFTRRMPQLLVYGSIAAVCGSVLLPRPGAGLVAAALLPIFAANLAFIAARRERLWLNDLLGILAASVVGAMSIWLGRHQVSTEAWSMLGWVAAYCIGTVWYVKTMIRERGKSGWLAWSIGWHAATAIAAALLSPWYLLVFGPALARSIALPKRRLTPKQVGLIEIGFTLLLAATAMLTTA